MPRKPGNATRLRGLVVLAGPALIGLGLSGCASTIDDLSSRRFREHPFKTLFVSDDPMTVLRDPESPGDQRIKAMRKLKEPKRYKGTDAEQDEVIALLTTTATAARQGLCRVAAIEALTRFEDPRVPSILVVAYQNARFEPTPAASRGGIMPASYAKPPSGPNFGPDMVALIQARALEGMGRRRSPEGLKVLVGVAATPTKVREPKSPDDIDLMAQPSLDMYRYDVRMAAVRALGHYEADPQAAGALVRILNEKDAAMRGRAHTGLVKITGKDLPPEPEQWQAVVQKGDIQPPPPTLIQRVGAWFYKPE